MITALSPLPTIFVPVIVTCMPTLKPAAMKSQVAHVSVLVGSAGSVAPADRDVHRRRSTCERFGSAT